METDTITTNKVYFAETNFRNQRKRFGIKHADRGKHIYIIGKTGMGKTTLLENMVIQDIQNGDGVGVIDPHGEFAEKMLDFVPKKRINDVIYVDPSDLAHPVGFNIMENIDPDKRHLVASGLMGVFKKIWVDVWSARMEYILGNTILALLEYPGSTLLSINRMLANKEFRKKVVDELKDPVVKSFWVDEFAKYTDRYTQEALPAIQNKIGQFISNPLIRNIVGQTKSSFDMREIMDKRKILIVNLSKGKIGEENSRLLGAMLITKLYLAAMSRIEIAREKDRPDFYLYVDEFQNFASESFANILSEARKYRLNLILAHQYITQMDEAVRDAVFGNVGTMVLFRVGAADAEFLEKEFAPEFSANDLVNLAFANIYLKLMIDGVASRPFSARTLSPMEIPTHSFREDIKETSQKHYGTPRKEIEAIIAVSIKETEPSFDMSSSRFQRDEASKTRDKSEQIGISQGKPFDKSKITKETFQRNQASQTSPQETTVYEATCTICGKHTLVPFKPDGRRPVFCKNHRKERQPQRTFQPQKTFSTPSSIPSIRSGENVLKDQNTRTENVSLDTLKKKPETKKEARSPDLASLRKTLAETLDETKDDTGLEESNVPGENNNGKVLKPGDKIQF